MGRIIPTHKQHTQGFGHCSSAHLWSCLNITELVNNADIFQIYPLPKDWRLKNNLHAFQVQYGKHVWFKRLLHSLEIFQISTWVKTYNLVTIIQWLLADCLEYAYAKICKEWSNFGLQDAKNAGNCKIILSFRWFHGRQYPRFLWDWLHPTQKGGRQC